MSALVRRLRGWLRRRPAEDRAEARVSDRVPSRDVWRTATHEPHRERRWLERRPR